MTGAEVRGLRMTRRKGARSVGSGKLEKDRQERSCALSVANPVRRLTGSSDLPSMPRDRPKRRAAVVDVEAVSAFLSLCIPLSAIRAL